MTVTLDPANTNSHITLSNGNLTGVGSNTTVLWTSTRSTLAYSAGKFYYEVTINALGQGVGAGFCSSTTATNNFIGADATGVMAFNHSGSGGIIISGNTVGAGIGTPPFTVGDTFGLAIDIAGKKVWFFNPENGLWNGAAIGSQNPAAGVGGIVVSGLTLPIFAGASLLNSSDQFTVNFGATSFAHTIPSGFSAWALSDVTVSLAGQKATSQKGLLVAAEAGAVSLVGQKATSKLSSIAAYLSAPPLSNTGFTLLESWQTYASTADIVRRWMFQSGNGGALSPGGGSVVMNGSQVSYCNTHIPPQQKIRIGLNFTPQAYAPTVQNSSFLHLLQGGETNSNNQIGLGQNPDGTLSVFFGQNFSGFGGTTLANGTTPLALGTAYWLELDVQVAAGAAGAVTLKINGVPEITLTGITTAFMPSAWVDRVSLTAGASAIHTIGGLYISDGSPGWIGPASVQRILLAADTAQRDFAPSTGGTNFSLLNTLDDAANVSSSNLSATDLYALAPPPSSPPTVVALQIEAEALQTNGANLVNVLAPVISQGGVAAGRQAIRPPAAFPSPRLARQLAIYDTTPSNAKWSTGTLAAALVGFRIAPFSCGFNFRATAGFVTDKAQNTFVINDVYPTTRNGLRFGWNTAGTGTVALDRSNGEDISAGINCQQNTGAQRTFRVDVPVPGRYQLRLILGDVAFGQRQAYARVSDGATPLFTLDSTILPAADFPVVAGNAMDAGGVSNFPMSTWDEFNRAREVTLTGTVLNVTIGSPAAGLDFSCLAHLEVVALDYIAAPITQAPPVQVTNLYVETLLAAPPSLLGNKAASKVGAFVPSTSAGKVALIGKQATGKAGTPVPHSSIVTVALIGNRGTCNFGRFVAVSSTVAVTFDPTLTNPFVGPSLSNNNLSVNGRIGASAARATLGRSTGKYYFEATVTGLGTGGSFGLGVAVGLCSPATSLIVALGSTADAIAAFNNRGNGTSGVLQNNVNIGSIGSPSFVLGETIGVAVDLDALEVLFFNPSAIIPLGGTWPFGVTPFPLTALTAPVFAAVGVTDGGDEMTANFTGPFTAVSVVSPDFLPWDTGAALTISIRGANSAARVGTIGAGVSANVTAHLAGERATSKAGGIIAHSPGIVPLVGERATSKVGLITFGVPGTVSLTGKQAASRVGAFSVSSAAVVSLVGRRATSKIGSRVPGLTKPLIGNQAAGTVGLLQANGNIRIPLAGRKVTSRPGAFSPVATVAVSGQHATLQAGALRPNMAPRVIGQRATTRSGTVTGAITIPLAGQRMGARTGAFTSQIHVGALGARLSGRVGTFNKAAVLLVRGQRGNARAGVVVSSQALVRVLLGQRAVARGAQLVAVPTFGLLGQRNVARLGAFTTARTLMLAGAETTTLAGRFVAGDIGGPQVYVSTSRSQTLARSAQENATVTIGTLTWLAILAPNNTLIKPP